MGRGGVVGTDTAILPSLARNLIVPALLPTWSRAVFLFVRMTQIIFTQNRCAGPSGVSQPVRHEQQQDWNALQWASEEMKAHCQAQAAAELQAIETSLKEAIEEAKLAREQAKTVELEREGAQKETARLQQAM